MIEIIPYFAGLITLLFAVGFFIGTKRNEKTKTLNATSGSGK